MSEPRMPETLDREAREELERLLKEAQDTPVPGGISASWDLIRTAIDALPALLAAEQRAEEAERRADKFYAALEAAWERFDAIQSSVKDPERVATDAYFGGQEVERAIVAAPHKAAEEETDERD